MTTEPTTYKLGTHLLAPGVHVKVKASPGKRDGFAAIIRSIRVDGDLVEITVAGGKPGRARHIRTFTPDRIQWVRQPKADT